MALKDAVGLPSSDDLLGDLGGDDSPDDMGSAKAKKLRASKRVMSAIKSGDAEALATALSDVFAACESYEGDDEAEEGDSEGD